MPSAIILATGCCSPGMRGSSSGGPAGVPAAGSLSLIGARVYWSRRPGGNRNGGRFGAARPARPRRRGEPAVAPLRAVRGAARLGRRVAVVAAERLGELRGLAVADRPCDGRHGQRLLAQQLGGVRHAHPLELAAEAGALLGEHALELAPRGRDRVGDGGQREVLVGEIAPNRGQRILEQGSPSVLGGLPHHLGIRPKPPIGCRVLFGSAGLSRLSLAPKEGACTSGTE